MALMAAIDSNGGSPPAGGPPLFSPRLDELLQEMEKGRAPNTGRFCGNCYTPMAKGRDACPHCGVVTRAAPPVGSIPPDVFDMFDRLRRREGYVVHSFAFAGLIIAFMVSFVMFYYLPGFPWIVLDAAALIGLTVTLPRLTGGWFGDELGSAWARRRLAGEWRRFEARRAASPPPTAPVRPNVAAGRRRRR